MPVAMSVKVKALSEDFGSQRRLADLLGVSPAQIGRWIRGQGIDPENADRVEHLELVMSQAARILAPDVLEPWLTSPNDLLTGRRRPIDAIRRGETREVVDALRQTAAMSFA